MFIDENVKTDYGRLKRLIAYKQNKKILKQIIETEGCEAVIVERFSFDRMYNEKYFKSLLFYLGLLTIKGRKIGITEFIIPNYVIKNLFWEYFREEMENEYSIEFNAISIQKAIGELAYNGNIDPFITYIKNEVLAVLSRRDLIRFDEKYIKVMLLSLLSLSPLYRIESESEVHKGYIDLFLERDIRYPDITCQWIWELKYIKESDRLQLDTVKEKGIKQLEAYSRDKRFSNRNDIKKALLVFIGKNDCMVFEAK